MPQHGLESVGLWPIELRVCLGLELVIEQYGLDHLMDEQQRVEQLDGLEQLELDQQLEQLEDWWQLHGIR